MNNIWGEIENLLDFLKCPICFEYFDDPIMELPNQHVFCKKCLRRTNEFSQSLVFKCPICNTAIENLVQARFVSNLLSTVSIKCKAESSEKKCKWFGAVADYWIHHRKCEILSEVRNQNLNVLCQEMKSILATEITPHLREEHTKIFDQFVRDWDWLISDPRDWKWWWWAENPWWEKKSCIKCNDLWHKYENDVTVFEYKRVCILKEIKQDCSSEK